MVGRHGGRSHKARGGVILGDTPDGFCVLSKNSVLFPGMNAVTCDNVFARCAQRRLRMLDSFSRPHNC